MSLTRWTPRLVRLVLCTLALVTLPAAASAQSAGRITGTVIARDGTPLADAQVAVVGTRLGASTGASGRFAIGGVPAGTYQLRALRIGHRSILVEGVVVRAGEETAVEILLEPAPQTLGGVVITASRRVEKITDAPATVTRVEADQIANTAGSAFTHVLKEAKGIDYIQTGLTTAALNARGFNSSFNNRMLMMEDGRIAVLPENGLPVGSFTTISKVDLAGVEVLVGPGAALYGADASNGVLTLQTKDPRQFPGLTAEVAGGNRGYQNVQFRYAGVSGALGYKVSGEWLAADEWENRLQYGAAPEIGIDWHSSVARGSGALVWYRGEQRLEVSGGVSQSNGVGSTNVGRNQLVDWVYNHQQVKWTTPSWYVNAYRTQSLSGESYAINRYSSTRPTLPASVSDDSVKKLSDWPADGRLYAAEVQNNFTVAPLLNTRVVWGGQVRQDRVSSKREWLTDRETGEDLELTQRGVYVQMETPLTGQFRLVLAGRYDKHDDYDAQFSPKAGLLFSPVPDQTIRFTYNRAFKSPTTLQNHFNIANFVANIGVFGNRMGFVIKDGNGTQLGTVAPLVPEENSTYELGYKGVIGERLFVDATGYYAQYDHFLTPLLPINVAAGATPTYAYFTGRTERIESEQGVAQTVLTYRNLGRAEMRGLDMGLRVLLTRTVGMSGTLSAIDVVGIEIPNTIPLTAAQRRELSSLNSSVTKWTIGMDATELFLEQLLGSVTVRHNNGYFFASGINVGTIPTFTTVDLSVGYRLPVAGTQLNVGVNNLYSCRRGLGAVPVDGAMPGSRCGFGLRHVEMVNMPAVGTMVFAGVRFHR